jgi:hypothetical protein
MNEDKIVSIVMLGVWTMVIMLFIIGSIINHYANKKRELLFLLERFDKMKEQLRNAEEGFARNDRLYQSLRHPWQGFNPELVGNTRV